MGKFKVLEGHIRGVLDGGLKCSLIGLKRATDDKGEIARANLY